jgi:hypothetical protein
MPIIYQYKRNNVTYAEVRSSVGVKEGQPKSPPIYLGKVIDIKKGYFQNNKLGVFKYTIKNGFESADIADQKPDNSPDEEIEILDFGSSYLLEQFSKKIGLWDLFRDTLPDSADSLMGMLFYYIEIDAPNMDAYRWLRGSYSSRLFPSTQLNLDGISELMTKLADESVVRDFFKRYLPLLTLENKRTAIIFESRGIPDAIHIPILSMHEYSLVVSEETRVIYVVDSKTGLPLFFNFDIGSIVDAKTLKLIFEKMKKFGVYIDHAILGSEYFSKNYLQVLNGANIKFLMRLDANCKIFQHAIDDNFEDTLSESHMYGCNGHSFGITQIKISLLGFPGYAYICVDHQARKTLIEEFAKGSIANNLPRIVWSEFTKTMGFFILVSSEQADLYDLLELFVARDEMEYRMGVRQINTYPLPTQYDYEKTFSGHVMLSFMATILSNRLKHCFRGTIYTTKNCLLEMRNLKCKVYKDRIIVPELTSEMKSICKRAGIDLPSTIKLPSA